MGLAIRARMLPCIAAAVAICLAAAGCAGSGSSTAEGPETAESPPALLPDPPVPTTAPIIGPTVEPTPAPTPTPAFQGWVDPATVGQNVGTTNGLLTFRGNPTRSYYGMGPVPESPQVQWRFGTGKELCSFSTVGSETTEWCGTGWTGQPTVFDYDERRWVVFGSYAPAVHFLDASTGERIIADFGVGDLIKGSVTIDPDEFPLVYFGSATASSASLPSMVHLHASCGSSVLTRCNQRCGMTTGMVLVSCSTTTCLSGARTRTCTSSSSIEGMTLPEWSRLTRS